MKTSMRFRLLSFALVCVMVLGIIGSVPFAVNAAAPTSYTTITAGSSASVSITTSGGAKYFKFVPTQSGTYKFYSSGSYDTKASLLDSNGILSGI